MRASHRLRDRELLRSIMDHPGRGTPYSIRTLADAAGCSRSFVGHLLSGRQDGCEEGIATGIAKALGVGILVLFMPTASPDRNDPSIKQDPPA